MTSDNFVVIQGWMCNELNLKGNELLVYALIYGFSQDGKSEYYAGRKYIADTFNISLPTVDKALEGLLNKNLIIKTPCENQAKTDRYKANISSKETLLGGSKETLPDNITSNINKTDNTNVLSTENSVEEFLTQDTPKKSNTKKQNLYSGCLMAIDEFTSSQEVRDCLKEYLNMRLANKSKPIGVASFKGMLKKLRTLTDSKEMCVRIIQQATDRCYLTFYPIKGPTYNTGCPEIISPGEKRQLTDEEYEEALNFGEKF